MRIAVVVQARMGSRRCPGKVLECARGKPLLGYVLERVSRAACVDLVILATSTDRSDDPLEAFGHAVGTRVFRGSLHDVAGRMLAACESEGLDAFVRVSGDSPLLDPSLIERAVALFAEEACDLVTNVYPRTFPSGQSVEVLDVRAFRRACAMIDNDHDREHVTTVMYAHPGLFRIRNFSADTRMPDVHLAVDDMHDLERFRSVVDLMREPHWTYGLTDVVALYAGLDGARV